jgi:hypothetical protein
MAKSGTTCFADMYYSSRRKSPGLPTRRGSGPCSGRPSWTSPPRTRRSPTAAWNTPAASLPTGRAIPVSPLLRAPRPLHRRRRPPAPGRRGGGAARPDPPDARGRGRRRERPVHGLPRVHPPLPGFAGSLGTEPPAAHLVYVDDADTQLLAARDVAAAHCPQSNAKAGRPISPAARMVSAGVRLGLATDGPLSGNGMDMQSVVSWYPKLQKVRELRRDLVGARTPPTPRRSAGPGRLGWET